MKLYNSLGPNPRVVRMFLREKGVEIATEEIDLLGGENRRSPYTDKNPAGQLPALELDDGTVLTEIFPICEYVEDKHPAPALIGETAEQKAVTRMWVRRLDLNIAEPMANGFRFSEGLDIFKDRVHCIPQAADDLKASANEWLAKLDGLIADNRFVVGDRFTMADIGLYCILDFGAGVGQALDPQLRNLGAWFERVGERASARASLHPGAAATGLRG